MAEVPRYRLIACEILFREICYCLSRCKPIVDVSFLPKGLHDMGERKMSARIQEEIERVDTTKYDAILLGYGLCNNGTRGLRSTLPIVLPRAHDCITLLMGSKEKYSLYFQESPGTYFHSTGWIERNTDPNDTPDSIPSQLGINRNYQEYVEKYGEDNARYLMDMLGDWLKNYKKLAYIDTHIGDFEAYKALTRDQARERGWEYEVVEGNVSLLMRLVNGDWNTQDFLVIPPMRGLRPTFDQDVIGLE